MCMVSMISDYGRERIQPQQWTRGSWGDYQEILRRLAELDRKLGEPDCQDSDKTDWMKAIEERLTDLETRLNT